jgi:ribonucleoside-diphosphate reductase alpha chain
MQIDRQLGLTENAIKVLERRYLIKDDEGKTVETPTELFHRVARHIAKAEYRYGAEETEVKRVEERYYNAIANQEFMPNSPTLMNAGRPLGQLSACFVLPVGDSMEEIFETIKHAALIHKSGGGTGFAFSRLRPRNSVVASTSGVASGPVSFMKVFNSATEAVKQGGTRRGANMGILRVDHPDIMEFISCKDDLTQVTNFNISVALTDEFMRALEENREYDLINPRTNKAYDIDGRPKRLEARKVFDEIVKHAWLTGEPGIIFLDRMNEKNPTNKVEQIEATNPCGEQPLPPYDSCNLASINLGRMALDPLPDNYSPREPENGVNWEKLLDIVKMGVNFLDDVIDMNKYPIPEIEQKTHANRRIGLGVMGWADMLVKLEVPYNSEEAFALGEKLMEYINNNGRIHSSELAKTRGKFPNWKDSVYADEGVSMRNATISTIAPTGTISIIAGCSSGIEPFFAVSFVRNVMDNTKLIDVNPLFEAIAKKRGFYSTEMMQKIAEANSIQEFEEIPEDVRRIFVTAADVSAEEHIRMQAAFQKNCDSSVSKTINMPNDVTEDDVRTAYWQAYKGGCKGVTIYRDGSRQNQVLSTGATPESSEQPKDQAEAPPIPRKEAVPKQRPATLEGFTEKIITGYGNLYITVNKFGSKPFEIFAQIGKSGYSTMADTEAISRLISLALRSGINVDDIIDQLTGIGGASPIYQKGEMVMSIPDAIAKVLKKHFGNGHHKVDRDVNLEFCPDCGGRIQHESGCMVCPSCGYSKC